MPKKKIYEQQDGHQASYIAPLGINEEVVRLISQTKNEPAWMLEKRLAGLKLFLKTPLPKWGPDLSKLELDKITYFVRSGTTESRSWKDVPADIKKTFERLGIPEAERKALAGVGTQYDSEIVYHNLKKRLQKKGVIFENMDVAVQKYPELVKKYFMTNCIPITDHKFIMLHAAVWSGGCLTEDSMVFTPNPGIKSIKDIEKGSEVFALDKNGRLQRAKVLGKIYSGRKEVYKILVGGRTLEATANHQFLCLEKSKVRLNGKGKKWKKVWKPLEMIEKGNLIAITKKIPTIGRQYKLPEGVIYLRNSQHQEKIKLPTETNEEFMWLMGFFIGDGNLYSSSEHQCLINFAIPKSSSLRTEVKNVIKKIFNYQIKTENDMSCTINSKKLGIWLGDIGFGGKAKTKRIPQWVFGLTLNEKFSFLGGLLDSDGWIENNGSTIRFELTNKKLVEDIKLLAFSCGLYSNGKIVQRQRQGNLYKKENRIIRGDVSYSCRINGNIKKIKTKDLRYKKVLGRNKSTFGKYGAVTGENFSSMVTEDIGFAPLKEKVPIGIKDVYDIQVENHHNFVVNGIIAHNSFIYVPKGIKVELPLQAYFRMNEERGGQFEHTLIIVDEGAELHYIEGCSSPRYISSSLHAGCVELHVLPRARMQYTSIENWSKNVYNLNTKRALVYDHASIRWVNGNMGSAKTMLYPCSVLMGEHARAESIGIAFAGAGQEQDTGSKVIHAASNTTSIIQSKSISKEGGITTYRGLVKVAPQATNVKSQVRCDALLLDAQSKSNTFPSMKVSASDAMVGHEATVSRIDEEQLFYLMSRGLNENQAVQIIINGFIDPVVKALPLEYAVELNRLISMEVEGL